MKSKVSSYRWIIILAIVPIIISTEMMWLSLSPILAWQKNIMEFQVFQYQCSL